MGGVNETLELALRDFRKGGGGAVAATSRSNASCCTTSRSAAPCTMSSIGAAGLRVLRVRVRDDRLPERDVPRPALGPRVVVVEGFVGLVVKQLGLDLEDASLAAPAS